MSQISKQSLNATMSSKTQTFLNHNSQISNFSNNFNNNNSSSNGLTYFNGMGVNEHRSLMRKTPKTKLTMNANSIVSTGDNLDMVLNITRMKTTEVVVAVEE